MPIFGRLPTADILPLYKKLDGQRYYIFIHSAVFDGTYHGSDRQNELISALMNRNLREDEIVALSHVSPEFGIDIGGVIWCETLTDAEANRYLEIFGLRLRLVEEIYRIPTEQIRQKAEVIERVVMQPLHKRHEDRKRRERWGY